MIKYSILIMSIILLLTSCSPIQEEIERVTSNNGKVDAVVLRSSGGGAAGSISYKVYLVPYGTVIKNKNKGERFLATKASNMKVYWENDQKLIISYPEDALIYNFSNFSYFRENETFDYRILLALNPIP